MYFYSSYLKKNLGPSPATGLYLRAMCLGAENINVEVYIIEEDLLWSL